MRFVYPLIIFISAATAVTGLSEGRYLEALVALGVAAVAGLLLVRNLRDPEKSRKGGEFAKITFMMKPGTGVRKKGTFARVDARKRAWNVALDRPPEREDFDRYGVPYRGWVWLDAGELPERIHVDAGMSWSSWKVHSAAAAKD